MLPSVLANELRQGIVEYVEAMFPMRNSTFRGVLSKQLDSSDFLVQAPFYSLQLPFRVVDSEQREFEVVKSCFKPYAHQCRAYERLSEKWSPDGQIHSTIVAAGTGAGKSECFLYPILDHCWKHRDEPGIKAVIIYPMNALALDQAKRIATLIFENSQLRGNVTAGLYVGGQGDESHKMGRESIVTSRETMRQAPPSILLTNYKMLDYLLHRPEDACLWGNNQPDTLRYLVVDELHTFDGPQGSDLACLVRRLKSRLGTNPGTLCCVGTSATLGGPAAGSDILSYAENLFGEPFEGQGLIGEERISAAEFLGTVETDDYTVPTPVQADGLLEKRRTYSEVAYIESALQAWFSPSFVDAYCNMLSPDKSDKALSNTVRCRIGQHLLCHNVFRLLLGIVTKGCISVSNLAEELRLGYGSIFQGFSEAQAEAAIEALLALVSEARALPVAQAGATVAQDGGVLSVAPGATLRPLLQVQVHIWMRELGRVMASLAPGQGGVWTPDPDLCGVDKENSVKFALEREMCDDESHRYLPVVNCSVCGETGWVCMENAGHNLSTKGDDINVLYAAFFGNAKVSLFFPREAKSPEGEVLPRGCSVVYICLDCARWTTGNCEPRSCQCGGKRFVRCFYTLEQRKQGPPGSEGRGKQLACPFCHDGRLMLVGVRSSSCLSTLFSQLLSSRFNDDKKVMAFSDSVQDAAYRAGFVNARSWNFVMRSAIQHYVENGGEGKTLAEFTRGCAEYWQGQYTKAEFVGRLIHPNMIEPELMDKIMSGLDAPKLHTVWEGLGQRVSYEAMLEYGLKSRFGRSLVRTGCSVLAVPAERIRQVAKVFRERARNQYGLFESDDLSMCEQLVAGFLEILRAKGAFADLIFDSFARTGAGKVLAPSKANVIGAQRWWMPAVHYGRNTPSFICQPKPKTKASSVPFDTEADDCYQTWVESCLCLYYATDPFRLDQLLAAREYGLTIRKNLGTIVKNELIEANILVEVPTKEASFAGRKAHVYGLNRDLCYVTGNVSTLRCDKCGQLLNVSQECAELWEGGPCLRRRCSGRVKPTFKVAGRDFFRWQYGRSDFVRVVAHEHTALLSADVRRSVEDSFKRTGAQRRIDDTNTLSCTSTMEMGIDIGDLSSVVLAGIPRTTAQYLQRSGRAGRRDGNSVVVSIANNRDHDLNYYADPVSMAQGKVSAPSLRLSTAAVLKRQYRAFCLDTWIRHLSGTLAGFETCIPRSIAPCLKVLKDNVRSQFPFTFLDYAHQNRDLLFSSFVTSYPDALDLHCVLLLAQVAMPVEEIGGWVTAHKLQLRLSPEEETTFDSRLASELEHLEVVDYAMNDDNNAILVAFRERQAAVDDLERSYSSLKHKRSELGKRFADAQHNIMAFDWRVEIGRQKLERHNLMCQDTWGFFSDSGLLPNYAFPETGVELQCVKRPAVAVFSEEKGDLHLDEWKTDIADLDENMLPAHIDASNRVKDGSFSLFRPAEQAIRELSPFNYFYAMGQKMQINQVRLPVTGFEPWRFCPVCDHAEKDEERTPKRSCPRCGSPGWGQPCQRRLMIPLQKVMANMEEGGSWIGDEGDGRREQSRYRTEKLVDVDDERDISRAYRVSCEGFEFGYEFVRKAVFREINYGLTSDFDGEAVARVAIGNDYESKPGFRICSECGWVQRPGGKQHHARGCMVDPDYTQKALGRGAAKGVEVKHDVFLYREFTTEAVRILVPATTDDLSHVRQASFVAALHLGLEKYHHSISNLKFCTRTIAIDGCDTRRLVVVIYDSIPGGTGLLDDLLRTPEHMLDIARLALEELNQCKCGDAGKDGCFKCLLAHKVGGIPGKVSRHAAIAMLEAIVKHPKPIVEVERLSCIEDKGLLQSELERDFVCKLSELPNITCTREVVNGKADGCRIVAYCDLDEGGSVSSAARGLGMPGGGAASRAGSGATGGVAGGAGAGATGVAGGGATGVASSKQPKSLLWLLEPQVYLGPADGVAVESRPDFVLWPQQDDGDQLPVAIFCDGLAYHNNRVDDDTRKRAAVRQSGRFRVWTVTSRDLDVTGKDRAAGEVLPNPKELPGCKFYDHIIGELYPLTSGIEPLCPYDISSMDLLGLYLRLPNIERRLKDEVRAYAFAMLRVPFKGPAVDVHYTEKLAPRLLGTFALSGVTPENLQAGTDPLVYWTPDPRGDVCLVGGVSLSELKSKKTDASISIFAWFRALDLSARRDFASSWRVFWKLDNLFQFWPGFLAVSEVGLRKTNFYADVWSGRGGLDLGYNGKIAGAPGFAGGLEAGVPGGDSPDGDASDGGACATKTQGGVPDADASATKNEGRSGVTDATATKSGEGSRKETAAMSPEWQEVKRYVSRAAVPFVQKLAALGVPAPSVDDIGYELDDGSASLAEIAWPTQKIAYLLSEQIEASTPGYTKSGWLVLTDSSSISLAWFERS